MANPAINLKLMHWINPPTNYLVKEDVVVMESDPHTDFWAKTHEGYDLANAPLFAMPLASDFTFSCKVDYTFSATLDQAGVMVYVDQAHWFKLCIEYTDETASMLAATVTTLGYSDMSSYSVGSDVHSMHFRISHHNLDFFLEYSYNGIHYKPMRLFHFDDQGKKFEVGLFVASPTETSFNATFSNIQLGPCSWKSEGGL